MLISKTNSDGHIELPIPHESGQWIKVVPMTAELFDAAVAANESKARRGIADFGKDVATEVLKSAGDDKEARERRRRNRARPAYGDMDRLTILRGCIVAWSYTTAVDDATIGTLDYRTADWIGQEIYRLSVPTEEETGNS